MHLIPTSLHFDISEDQKLTTVGNAENISVSVPEGEMVTVAFYKQDVQTVPQNDLSAIKDEKFIPIASIVLPGGLHVLVKSAQTWIGSDGDGIYCTALQTRPR